VSEQTKTATETEDIRPYVAVTDLEYQGRAEGLDCYRIPSPSGLRPDSYDRARRFLESLVSYLTTRLGCDHESFVQMGQATDRPTAHLFADHARQWIPEMGLGVWPHRPPPRQWMAEDLEDMDPESGMPTLLYSLYRVTAPGNARLDAMTVMAGTGTGLQIMTRMEGAKLFHDLKDLFLGFIQDRVFRIFPWYVPLLDKAALVEPMNPLTVHAMRGISLYIRESPEDGGILIVSAEPLTEIFTQLGCERIEDGLAPKWKLGG
jgi:hypothetical protein